jgi:hypothetical protein
MEALTQYRKLLEARLAHSQSMTKGYTAESGAYADGKQNALEAVVEELKELEAELIAVSLDTKP